MTLETLLTADAGGEALMEKRPPSQAKASMEQRYAENVQLQIKLLIAQLQNTQGGSSELATSIGELGKRAEEIGTAITSGSTVDMMRVSDAALMFYAQHYTAIMQEAEKIKDKETKEATEKTAELLMHAAEVAQTKHFMEHNIDGFNGLSEPAKQYFAEDVQKMLDKDPELAKAMRMSDAIENNPALKQEMEACRDRAKKAWEDLLHLADNSDDPGSEQMKKDLLRMRELMGKDKLVPAELIAIKEKLDRNEITLKEAQDQIHATVEKTEKVVKGILFKSYESLGDDQQSIIAEHLGKKPGEKVTAEELMKFMKEMEEKDLLKPDRINEAFERMQHGEATEEDKLVIAAASLKFKTEVGKGLYNVASHLMEMKEREPEKYKEFMEKIGKEFSEKDADGVIKLLEDYGVAKADGITYEQKQYIKATVRNLNFEEMQQVIGKVQEGITTGHDVSKDITGIYFTAMERQAAEKGINLADYKNDPEKLAALRNAFMQEVYSPGIVADNTAQQQEEDTSFSLSAIIDRAQSWIIGDEPQGVAENEADTVSPGMTPQTDTQTAQAASRGNAPA